MSSNALGKNLQQARINALSMKNKLKVLDRAIELTDGVKLNRAMRRAEEKRSKKK